MWWTGASLGAAEVCERRAATVAAWGSPPATSHIPCPAAGKSPARGFAGRAR